MEEFYLASNGAGRMHCALWEPESAPRAVVQIIHGIAEHIGRYDHFARFLTQRGFVVCADDHMGHGLSVEAGGSYGYFSGGWLAAVADERTLYEEMKRRYPALPYLMLGHSMGSFLLRTYLYMYPGELSGAIISGTGWQPEMTIRGGLLLAGILSGLKGPDAVSKLVTNMAFGAYNKAFGDKPRTPNDWLSADTDNVDRYMADPLCGADATVGLFRQMLHGIRFNQRQSHLRQMDREMPELFVAGDKDPVGSCGKGVRQTYDAFRAAGMRDCTLKLYPGLRHEILNEKAYTADITKNIEAWLLSRLEK